MHAWQNATTKAQKWNCENTKQHNVYEWLSSNKTSIVRLGCQGAIVPSGFRSRSVEQCGVAGPGGEGRMWSMWNRASATISEKCIVNLRRKHAAPQRYRSVPPESNISPDECFMPLFVGSCCETPTPGGARRVQQCYTWPALATCRRSSAHRRRCDDSSRARVHVETARTCWWRRWRGDAECINWRLATVIWQRWRAANLMTFTSAACEDAFCRFYYIYNSSKRMYHKSDALTLRRRRLFTDLFRHQSRDRSRDSWEHCLAILGRRRHIAVLCMQGALKPSQQHLHCRSLLADTSPCWQNTH